MEQNSTYLKVCEKVGFGIGVGGFFAIPVIGVMLVMSACSKKEVPAPVAVVAPAPAVEAPVEVASAPVVEKEDPNPPIHVEYTKPEPTKNDYRNDIWVEQGKDAVKAKLKDSNSAKFRNAFFNRGSDGIPMSCGQVNSKNSFGGYSGWQRYVSGGSSDLTFLEEQVSDFNVVWNRFCT